MGSPFTGHQHEVLPTGHRSFVLLHRTRSAPSGRFVAPRSVQVRTSPRLGFFGREYVGPSAVVQTELPERSIPAVANLAHFAYRLQTGLALDHDVPGVIERRGT